MSRQCRDNLNIRGGFRSFIDYELKGKRVAMKIFFEAAIQGAQNREERAAVHRLIIDAIKSCGCEVISKHTIGKDYDTCSSFDRTFLTESTNVSAFFNVISASSFEA